MNEDGYGNFARERQRRLELNDKFEALRSLVPNPTQADRGSVLRDAIEYIGELEGTVKELKLVLVDNNATADIVGVAAEDQGPPTCQLCNNYGHLASHCNLRFDQNFNNPNANTPNGSQGNNSAYVASPGTVNDPEWLADSGPRRRLEGS